MTPQEFKIAKLRIQGLTYRDISQRLNVCEKTIGAHLHNLYKKMNVHNTQQLAIKLKAHLGNSLTESDLGYYD